MRQSRRGSRAAAAVAGLVLLAGCGDTAGGAGDDEDEIVLGVVAGTTGFMSSFDGPVLNALTAQADELNAAGGIDGKQLRIITADNRSDPNLSAEAAIDLIEQGADILIAPCDYDIAAPAAQEAQNAGILALSCAGSPLFGVAGIGNLAFTANEGSPTQSAVAADFAADQGWRTAYLLTDTGTDFTTSWCDGFEHSFTAAGGTIIGSDTFTLGDTSIAAQVTRLQAGPAPDVIALCSFPPTGATAIKQLRAAGVTAPIVTTSGFDGPAWLDAVPGVSDVYAIAPASVYGDDPRPEINELVADYTAEHGDPQTSYLVYGAQMMEIIQETVESTGSTDGVALAGALEEFQETELLLGPTSYSPTCRIAVGRPMNVIEYQDGAGAFATRIDPTDVAPVDGCE